MTDCERNMERISALLDGELPPADAAELRAHMAECPECRAMYQAFAALSTAVTAEEPLPEHLHDNIMSTVRQADQALRKQRKLVRLRAALTTAACLVVLTVTVFSLNGSLSRSKSADRSDASMFLAPSANGAAAPEAAERSGDLNADCASVEGAAAFDAAPADAPELDLPMPTPAPALAEAPQEPAGGEKNQDVSLQQLTLEVTTWEDDRITGTVRACSGEIFPAGQELTVVLEGEDSSDHGAWTVIAVDFDRWEGNTVYASSVQNAE